MGGVILGDDEATARLFVETMNDAGTLFPADSRQRRTVVEERVDQSVFAMTSTRMNDKPRRFIDDDEIVVFEEYLKRDRLWQRLDLFQRRLGELNLIATSNNLAWPAGRVVESNKPIADQLLES
jgi:hypothetical protein